MLSSYISNINIAIHIVYLKDLSICNNARYCRANKTLDTSLIKKTKVCPSYDPSFAIFSSFNFRGKTADVILKIAFIISLFYQGDPKISNQTFSQFLLNPW